jgi:Arc/MetJ-type ribon-helix-helix transcriptional regulator
MKLITLKLEETMLVQMDNIVSAFGFGSRTEFIRNALRDKVEEYRLKHALLNLSKGNGALKGRNFTDEEYEMAREKAFEKIAAEFKQPLQA